MRTFKNHVWTSEEANQKANKEKNIDQVWRYLKSQGKQGATDDEIQVAVSMDGNSERPSRRTLEKEGHVKRTKQWRITRKGFKAIVWVARCSS
jgi:hypothetical protein